MGSKRRHLSEAELAQPGPNVRISDVAAIIDLSKEAVRAAVREDGMAIEVLRRGQNTLHRITREDARRLLRKFRCEPAA